MTHAQTLRGQFNYNRKQVLWLTGLSPEHYEGFITDTAKGFVDQFEKLFNVDALLDTPFFWDWWHFMWNDADEVWILPALYATTNNRYAEYRVLHQYIFDTECTQYKQFMADFMSLRQTFEKEISKRLKTTKHAAKTI